MDSTLLGAILIDTSLTIWSVQMIPLILETQKKKIGDSMSALYLFFWIFSNICDFLSNLSYEYIFFYILQSFFSGLTTVFLYVQCDYYKNKKSIIKTILVFVLIFSGFILLELFCVILTGKVFANSNLEKFLKYWVNRQWIYDFFGMISSVLYVFSYIVEICTIIYKKNIGNINFVFLMLDFLAPIIYIIGSVLTEDNSLLDLTCYFIGIVGNLALTFIFITSKYRNKKNINMKRFYDMKLDKSFFMSKSVDTL